MKIHQRIWKTGALAVLVTLIGGMFVMRLADWTRGLTTDYVYAQGTGTGGTGGASGTAATVTKVIPQIVAGGGYKTTIQIINPGTAAVNVNADFYTQAGVASTASIKTDLNGTTATVTGKVAVTSIPVNGIFVITFEGATDPVTSWGTITSTAAVTVAAFFEARDGAQNLLSRVGVSASPADMKQFVIPRVHNIGPGLDVGFAVANTGATSATANVSLRNAAGVVLATKALTLDPKAQTAVFTNSFFGAALTNPAGQTYSALTFTSDSAQFAAIALVFENNTGPGHDSFNFASFPVDRLQ